MRTLGKNRKEMTFYVFYMLLIGVSAIGQQPNDAKTLWTLAWSPDGKYIGSGGNQDELILFDANTFELVKTYPVKDALLSRIKWHPSKNILAIITQGKTIKARILNLDKDEWIDLEGLESSSRGLDWNFNGALLAVSELEHAVSVFTLHGKRVSRFMADPKSVTGIDWHPTKNIMTTVGSQIGIYDHLGHPIHTFRPRNKEVLLLCVEWHDSGDFFVVGDYGDLENADDKLLQFWHPEGVKINEISGSIAEYRNIRWSTDGERWASASDALRIWSKEGKLLAETKSSDDYLWGVDWSPDGDYIVTSSSNGKLVIWDKNANFIRQIGKK
ncbi:MAG: hypothetical protein Mars2KO_09460 [Maribacter sp.]